MRRVRSAQGVSVRKVDGFGRKRFATSARRSAERAAEVPHRTDGIARTARRAHLHRVAHLAIAESRVLVAARGRVLLADVALRRAVEQRREGSVKRRAHSASPNSYRVTTIPARSHTSQV